MRLIRDRVISRISFELTTVHVHVYAEKFEMFWKEGKTSSHDSHIQHIGSHSEREHTNNAITTRNDNATITINAHIVRALRDSKRREKSALRVENLDSFVCPIRNNERSSRIEGETRGLPELPRPFALASDLAKKRAAAFVKHLTLLIRNTTEIV